ncbi:hypothetical protein [Paenibacillus sp. AN1007]|uniref:Uncharacterized protein n=1 Tax=Paenibacillus sp. AN1007 TaxID=3151385 RepID=A0AAU8NGQ2_9BACL
MRNEGVDTLYLEPGDIIEIKSYLANGTSFLGSLETKAFLDRVTSSGKIPEYYKKLEASETDKAQYPDLFAKLEYALKTRSS